MGKRWLGKGTVSWSQVDKVEAINPASGNKPFLL
jgi:hypothetical protein